MKKKSEKVSNENCSAEYTLDTENSVVIDKKLISINKEIDFNASANA